MVDPRAVLLAAVVALVIWGASAVGAGVKKVAQHIAHGAHVVACVVHVPGVTCESKHTKDVQ